MTSTSTPAARVPLSQVLLRFRQLARTIAEHTDRLLLSDKALAYLLAAALDVVDPEDETVATDAAMLAALFDQIAEHPDCRADNGYDPDAPEAEADAPHLPSGVANEPSEVQRLDAEDQQFQLDHLASAVTTLASAVDELRDNLKAQGRINAKVEGRLRHVEDYGRRTRCIASENGERLDALQPGREPLP